MKVFWLFALVGMACPGVVGQAADSAVESRIVAMEKAWNQAYKLRDAKAIDEILDDAIVLVNDDGSLQSKSAFLATVKHAKPSEEEQVETESLTVHATGSAAVATGVFLTKGTSQGKPFLRRDRFLDTWVSKGSTWVCISASATPLLH